MHKNSVFQPFSMNPFNFQLFPQITYSSFPNYFYKSQMQWNIRNKQQQNITDFEFSICLWFERFAVKHRFLFFLLCELQFPVYPLILNDSSLLCLQIRE